MVAPSHRRLQPALDDRPAPSLSETVQRIRLIRLAHSPDPLAAAIATLGVLLLPRIDRLIEQEGRTR